MVFKLDLETLFIEQARVASESAVGKLGALVTEGAMAVKEVIIDTVETLEEAVSSVVGKDEDTVCFGAGLGFTFEYSGMIFDNETKYSCYAISDSGCFKGVSFEMSVSKDTITCTFPGFCTEKRLTTGLTPLLGLFRIDLLDGDSSRLSSGKKKQTTYESKDDSVSFNTPNAAKFFSSEKDSVRMTFQATGVMPISTDLDQTIARDPILSQDLLEALD